MAEDVGSPIVGFSMKLYRSPIAATDVWTEIGGVENVSIDNISREVVEVAYRGCTWKRNMPGMMEAAEATFKLIHNVQPEMEEVLRNDMLNATPAKYAMVNGDITVAGTEGWIIPAYITQMNRSEDLGEIVSNDVKMSLGHILSHDKSKLLDPEWLVVE